MLTVRIQTREGWRIREIEKKKASKMFLCVTMILLIDWHESHGSTASCCLLQIFHFIFVYLKDPELKHRKILKLKLAAKII